MASVNKVILVGNLGKDPELRYAPSGDAFCTITIACTDSYKDKATGEKKEITEWVRVVFNGKLAEIAGKYLKKGRSVYVEGSLRTRKWTNKEGKDQYTTEIRADQMQMLGGSREGGERDEPTPEQQENRRAAKSVSQQMQSPGGSGFNDFDDGIPF